MNQQPAPPPDPLLGTLVCFGVIWLILDRSAALLGSMRGEAGLLICALVVAAAVACEAKLSRRSVAGALSALGLGRPALAPLLWTTALMSLLLLSYPIFALATGVSLSVWPGAALLALGVFAQGGVAEEVLFRGFLFRRIRVGRSFWHAASLAAVPFVAVHLLLFLTLDFAVAAAAILVSLSLSFPLAWLFERSGNSIWPPAIVHAVLQGAPKLLQAGDNPVAMALIWMVIGAVAPWVLFLLRPKSAKVGRSAQQ